MFLMCVKVLLTIYYIVLKYKVNLFDIWFKYSTMIVINSMKRGLNMFDIAIAINKLEKMRMGLLWTRVKLAKEIGISYNTYLTLINNKTNHSLSMRTLQKIDMFIMRMR